MTTLTHQPTPSCFCLDVNKTTRDLQHCNLISFRRQARLHSGGRLSSFPMSVYPHDNSGFQNPPHSALRHVKQDIKKLLNTWNQTRWQTLSWIIIVLSDDAGDNIHISQARKDFQPKPSVQFYTYNCSQTGHISSHLNANHGIRPPSFKIPSGSPYHVSDLKCGSKNCWQHACSILNNLNYSDVLNNTKERQKIELLLSNASGRIRQTEVVKKLEVLFRLRNKTKHLSRARPCRF